MLMLGRELLACAGPERIRRKPQASIGGVRSRGLGDSFVKSGQALDEKPEPTAKAVSSRARVRRVE